MEMGSVYRMSAAYVLTLAGRELRQCCSITFYELSMSKLARGTDICCTQSHQLLACAQCIREGCSLSITSASLVGNGHPAVHLSQHLQCREAPGGASYVSKDLPRGVCGIRNLPLQLWESRLWTTSYSQHICMQNHSLLT